MTTTICVLIGRKATGKSALAVALAARIPASFHLSTSALLAEMRGSIALAANAQDRGRAADRDMGPSWYWGPIVQAAAMYRVVLVDALRTFEQVDFVRVQAAKLGWRVVTIRTRVGDAERVSRLARRGLTPDAIAELDRDPTEVQADLTAFDPTLTVHGSSRSPEELADWICESVPPFSRPVVDVLYGGQYGSEGKGNVCSWLCSDESRNYRWLVRTGGPNAGHTAYLGPTRKLVFYHLPSGCQHAPNAGIVLGPGAAIDPHVLLRELQSNGVDPARVHIHPYAFVILDAAKRAEASALVQAIGSTGMGVGKAAEDRLRRMAGSAGCMPFGWWALEHEDVPSDLKAADYELLGSMVSRYTDRWGDGPMTKGAGRVFVEGTQGFGLSLLHGAWPYTTSRDTTPAAFLSEAGFSPADVNEVWGVYRTYPIRVESPAGGTSGPMPGETTWEVVAAVQRELAGDSGVTADTLRERERTTTTRRLRRVATFNSHEYWKSASVCGPTHAVLTFADYLGCHADANGLHAVMTQPALTLCRMASDAGYPFTHVAVGPTVDHVFELSVGQSLGQSTRYEG